MPAEVSCLQIWGHCFAFLFTFWLLPVINLYFLVMEAVKNLPDDFVLGVKLLPMRIQILMLKVKGQGRSQRGGHGWMSPPIMDWKKILAPITDRWLLCNWCHTPDVAKTKGKCAISTLIFQKFSGGYALRPPYWGGAMAPLPRPHRHRHFGLRVSLGSGPSVPPSLCPPLQKS